MPSPTSRSRPDRGFCCNFTEWCRPRPNVAKHGFPDGLLIAEPCANDFGGNDEEIPLGTIKRQIVASLRCLRGQKIQTSEDYSEGIEDQPPWGLIRLPGELRTGVWNTPWERL